MNRKCPICKKEYDDGGDSWKKVCYNCYKDFRYLDKRIESIGYQADVYISHPSVTKEEMDNWIKEKKLDQGWGCQEYIRNKDSAKVKIWINSINFD
jgi:predicted  nucleic acid-binding Zn-ribbon protein